MGKDKVARYSKYILMERQMKNPAIQNPEAVPDVSLALPKQVANPTSNKPAIISNIQFMLCVLRGQI